MIKVKNLTKTYRNGQEALKNISFEIEQGEFVYCVGPSGSGKSTLFKMIAKETEITDGSIQLNQYRVDRLPNRHLFMLRRQVGIVAQEDLLLPHVSCFQNIAFSLKVLGLGPKEIREKTQEVLEMVDMQAFPPTDNVLLGSVSPVTTLISLRPLIVKTSVPVALLPIFSDDTRPYISNSALISANPETFFNNESRRSSKSFGTVFWLAKS